VDVATIYRRAAGLRHRLLAVAVLLVFFALALDTAGRKAVTTDEPLHLAHAVTLLQTGAMRIPEMHVPLTYRLAGALLRTEGPLPDVTTSPSWATLNPYEIGREYLWRDDLPTDRVIWLGRFVVVALGVLLGALLAAWTRALTGGHLPATGLTLGLYALSPNFLAAAALLTTDMAATVTWFACVYAWWRFWRRPTGWRWLVAAVCLGLALAAKLTGVLLLPVTLLLAYIAAWAAGQIGRRAAVRAWLRPGLLWLGLLPVAAAVLWALYGFETRAGLPMPAYAEAWRLLLTEVETSHLNFFLGQISSTGSWWYFPVTLLLKTPLLQLALFCLIPFVLWRVARRGARRMAVAQVVFLALPAAGLLAVAAASRLNFGYRHALPAVPFLMALGGLGMVWLWQLPGRRARIVARAALALAAAWTFVAAVRTHPNHLPYFNELARGRGHALLGDSNLDWGQDLNLLADHARAYVVETGRTLRFSYSGIADRAHYGLAGPSLIEQFRAGDPTFAPANPAAGRYAISTSDLQGTGLTLGVLDEIDLFDWFRRRRPLTTLGGSIFVYDVAAPAEGAWLAHCATPGRALDDATAERLVGRAGLRHLTFNCHASWVFPDGPGWYVLPLGEADWLAAWLDAPPSEVYRHRANAYGPDYLIAYWPGDCSFISPAPLPPCSPALLPHKSNGDAAAHLQAFASRDTEWLTLWQVAEATAAPLSIQAHLLAADGAIQVADGLGFPADQWRPGDVFLQRHVFDAPGDTLETGLYNYVTLEPAGTRARLTPD